MHLCNPMCAEGCVCDAGYLWSGNKCIRQEQCGCEHNGRYYNVGDLLWLSDCTKRCSCENSSAFHCVPASCNPGQQCAVQDGKLGCKNQLTTCTISGDPHYFTFDGAVAHFQGSCAYEISKTPNSSLDFSFRVVATNKNFRNPRVSFIYRVDIWLSFKQFSSHVVLERGKAVKVDGRPVALPAKLEHLANITKRSQMVTVRTHPSLEVQYNGRHALFVRVGPEYWGKLSGMCGNFNGYREDDKVLPDGKNAKNDAEFGNAWMSNISPPKCTNDTGALAPCTNHLELKQKCAILTDQSGPFSECHWHEEPDPYYNSCIFDLCQYGQGHDMLCAAIETYEEMCQSLGVQVLSWREELGCAITCPPNAYYDFCGTACPLTCANHTALIECPTMCIAGCICLEGHVLNEGACIPLGQCGCRHNGRDYQLGDEMVLPDTCRKRCSCKQLAALWSARSLLWASGDMQNRGWHLGLLSCVTGLWVFGYFHVITFSGAALSYQGPCTYILTQYCGPPGKLPAFTIRIVNGHRYSIAASWTRQLTLDVYREHIVVKEGQEGKVQVNGLWMNLPVILASGKLHAYYSGSSVIVQTEFGLSISYDWSSYVSVSVPETYSGFLCGLGGDFIENHYQDFRTPNSSIVHARSIFGSNWKKIDSPSFCTVVDISAICNETQLALFRSQNYCGVISDRDGPFKECGNLTGFQNHVENCVMELCAHQGARKTLCEALQSYAWQCQVRGINIQPWREMTECELTCPPNSYYELCGSPCPASCTQPAGPPSCFQSVCVEGCQCEAGFVLSGIDCVPWEQCGCSYNERYYFKGEIFFLEAESCRKRYHCDGAISAMEADGSFCGPEQFCGTRKGVFGCHNLPDGICQVSKFLHYTTFDGQQYNFQGNSTYVLVELCPTSKTSPFRVEVKNEKLPNSPLSVLSKVIVSVNDTQIYLQREDRGTVKIDGVIANLPGQIQALGIAMYQHGFYTVLKTEFGLIVNYDPGHNLFVTLSPEYRGLTCGLCGNFNELMEDDFRMRNGSATEDILDFVLNWTSETNLADTGESVAFIPMLEQGEDLTRFKSLCWIIQDPDGPFASCQLQVDPLSFFTGCIFDLHASSGDQSTLCHSVQIYVAACQRANVTISPWRRGDFCGLDCQTNSHYELCGVPCQDVCSHVWVKIHCLPTCSEGCFCDHGHSHSGDSCIPEQQCGCIYNGLNYKIGDRVWLPGCHEQCSCYGPSDFRCVAASCNPGQICTVKDGKVGCHSPWGTCTVSGDPHYVTFDGSVAHFQGTCAYEISKLCNASSPFFYRVVAQNQHRGNARVSFVTRVEIMLKSGVLSFHIVLRSGHIVEVNQEIVELPYTLELTGFISKIKNMVIVKLAANVEIHYNGQHTLFIKVGPEYQQKLCGMCGNFNGILEDDKVLPDGSRAQNDLHFGNAWKTETSPAGCLDDNSTLEPCENPWEYEQLCGILVNQTGPFAKCSWHVDPSPFYLACLYDLCHYGRHNNVLCIGLAAYEEMCLLEGIQIPGWRASVQCPATDPCLDLACGDNEWCGERGGKWGCFCHKSYSPTERADYDYQLTCTSSGSTVSLSRCLLFTDGFPAERLHLADHSCKGSLVGDRLVFHFDAVQKTCGTQMEVNTTHAIYTNVVQGHLENTYGGTISRDRFLFLRFSCAFPLNINLSMASVIYPIHDIINMTVSSGQGRYQAIMTLYQDPEYSKPFAQSPIVLTVNHRAYVGIKILGADPTRFVVTLSSCWATPGRDPSSSIRWDLITNQCPNPQDGTVHVEEDGVSLLGRFSFSVFTFIADSEEVYLHCRIRLCNFWMAKCTLNCHSPGSAILGRKPPSAIISAGPFLKYSSNLLDPAL
ncbi:alpha-tectorin-like [Thamnophis elegans]|uniref:alpha-tectorin-like n=1 Tax=Thamnophis elegans TaxID=35005 RepID=UPI0013790273|nr:alpha-tectorin-like [Thamnophis elegans]